MGTVTLQLSDDKYEQLQQLAQRRQVSLNQLLDELTTQALVEEDAYMRFQWRAGRGSINEGLRLLGQLDQAEK